MESEFIAMFSAGEEADWLRSILIDIPLWGSFALKRKFEDLVLHAEMLAPMALEFEEARRLKQEEIIREYDLWDDLAKSNEDLVQLAESAKAIDARKDLRYKAEEAKLITELVGMDSINYDILKQAYTFYVNVNKTLDKYENLVEQLTKMYIKWTEKQGHKAWIVEKQDSDSGGIRYVMIDSEFKSVYDYLSGERGIHYMSGSSENKQVEQVDKDRVDKQNKQF
ncbi:hypothetical protein CQW23_07439 [Capsicum baccatum]|uniref:Peptide chain release factor domain-containing protein n=1 Tax=Capsicum baccatum TaxID=33114 RepID=A0A2G2X678_CAPBA|nr:hypothetical protein CQW23_07439 [Capsicum baccatum]